MASKQSNKSTSKAANSPKLQPARMYEIAGRFYLFVQFLHCHLFIIVFVFAHPYIEKVGGVRHKGKKGKISPKHQPSMQPIDKTFQTLQSLVNKTLCYFLSIACFDLFHCPNKIYTQHNDKYRS